jgi:hypothetical protein
MCLPASAPSFTYKEYTECFLVLQGILPYTTSNSKNASVIVGVPIWAGRCQAVCRRSIGVMPPPQLELNVFLELLFYYDTMVMGVIHPLGGTQVGTRKPLDGQRAAALASQNMPNGRKC